MSSPVPTTATGGAPSPSATWSAPAWAAPSIPRANPDTTTTPEKARSRPRSTATWRPYGVADRVPTIATRGRPSNTEGSPWAKSTAGAPGSSTSMDGYCSAPGSSIWTPARRYRSPTSAGSVARAAAPNRRSGSAGWRPCTRAVHEIVDVTPVDPNGDIEPVEERCGQASGVALPGAFATPTPTGCTAFTTWARVHGSDQNEPGRKGGGPPGPAHPDLAFLQRLAEGVEYHSGELAQFVEEQHPPMGQADFTRPHPRRPTPDHRHRRRTVMRGAERRPNHQAAGRKRQACHRVHPAHLLSLIHI